MNQRDNYAYISTGELIKKEFPDHIIEFIAAPDEGEYVKQLCIDGQTTGIFSDEVDMLASYNSLEHWKYTIKLVLENWNKLYKK